MYQAKGKSTKGNGLGKKASLKTKKIEPKTVYQVEYIEWADASSTLGWFDRPEELAGLMIVRSVGIIFDETEDSVTITTSLCEDGGVTDPFTIPKSGIKSRKALGTVEIS